MLFGNISAKTISIDSKPTIPKHDKKKSGKRMGKRKKCSHQKADKGHSAVRMR